MKKLFLHIGPPKTGSTTIQEFLHARSTDLLNEGVLYPVSSRARAGESFLLIRQDDRTRLSAPLTSHLVLGYALRGQIDGIEADCCWAELLNEISSTKPEAVLLSAEIFGNLSMEYICKIREYLRDFDVHIIVYIREPFARVLSQWTQSVKTGRCYQSLRRHISGRADCLVEEYTELIEAWAEVFGHEHLIVKDFDGIAAETSGLECDFLRTIGLNPKSFGTSQMNHSKNQSPNPEAVRLILGINAIEWILGRPQIVRPMFVKVRSWILRSVGSREQLPGSLFGILLRPLKDPLFDERDRQSVESIVGETYRKLIGVNTEEEEPGEQGLADSSGIDVIDPTV